MSISCTSFLELVAPASDAVKKVGEQSVESAADQMGHFHPFRFNSSVFALSYAACLVRTAPAAAGALLLR
jgi:hypothetical protein